MRHAKLYLMHPGKRGPLVVQALDERIALSNFVAGNLLRLEELLLEHGSVLFRAFACPNGFASVIDVLPYQKLDYVYRSTPRTHLEGKIYTATEYPPDQTIPLHNESAYQREWPGKLILYCERPALRGGATPIADMQRVTANIGNDLLDEFESRGVQYIRHYHEYIDIPWEVVFQCNDREQLARFCAEHDISHSWLDDRTLRTIQVCQGAIYHPISTERVFFNQAHLFHSSSLGPRHEQEMVNVFGRSRLPRHARFGDGSEIAPHYLEAIRRAFKKEESAFAWRAGDMLVLDNMQFAHGRQAYEGARRVLAALLDPMNTNTPGVAGVPQARPTAPIV